MKKLVVLLLVLVLLIGVFSGCGNDKENVVEEKKNTVVFCGKEVHYDDQGIKTTVKVRVYSAKTKTITETYSDGFDEYINEYKYDEKGNLIQEIYYYYGVIISEKKYTYSDSGKLLSEVHYGEKEKKEWSCKYEYNQDDILISRTESDKYDKKTKYTYSYDENGYKVLETKYNTYGYESATKKYTYDDNGNLIRCTQYDTKEDILAEETYEYDSNGNKTREIKYDGTMKKDEYRYEYDSKGNKTREIEYDGTMKKDEYCYEYDSAGNVIRYMWYSSSGNVMKRTEYSEYQTITFE